MLQIDRSYQLNMWKLGLNHAKSFAHIRGFGQTSHVLFLYPKLPENIGFDIIIKRINYGKSIEAVISNIGKEFNMENKERKKFRGLKLSIQTY